MLLVWKYLKVSKYEHINFVLFIIVSNSGSDKFTIDATSGEIKLSKALDYEAITTKYYEIIVVATDGGGLPVKIIIVINISVQNYIQD